ncbi:MAG: NAD(P)-dependent oxidoreductase, partial [Armatimonadetes bacterium]|nr:NAD(P)-dependent oxidoreductase [Armatimonadota bacterium]
MAEALILGGSGQLGSQLAEQLGEKGIGLPKEQADITDPSSLRAVLDRFRPQRVFNCAAYVRVDDAEDKPEVAFRVNALGPLFLARLCQEREITLVHISTDYVFDGRKGGPYTELDPPNPLNVYGATKLLGEFFVRAYCSRHFVVR